MMLGRLFGRGKDENDGATCAECGRTLLAGEWTQRIVDEDGHELLVCALCARAGSSAVEDDAVSYDTTPAGTGRVKDSRTESDAFWRALKDKDAEIERLESMLAHAEAEKQELRAQLAALGGELRPARRDARPDELDASLAEDSREARERVAAETTMAFTPPVFDEEPAVGPETEPAPADEYAQASLEPSETGAERTDPRLGEALRAAASGPADPGAGETQAAEPASPAAEETWGAAGDDAEVTGQFRAPADESEPTETFVPAAEAPAPFESEEDLGPSLVILQRGVDLLNVSAVPKRIVETNENLGLAQVHVGADDESTLLITFMWTLGWYQFKVELAEGGRITLAERGYDSRGDLRPNASVRADGTVQLAPTFIKGPTPRDTSAVKPAAVTSGVIISKSMMGQRTDDENVPADWKTQNAPDFDWGR